MDKYRRLRFLSYLVIVYMLMAFTWWSVLLYTKNKDAFRAKSELLRIGMVAEDLYQNETHFLHSEPYLELEAKYNRQEWMIAGEAAVFVLTLIIGVWFINRGYNKEMQAAQQRRNFLLSITHELKSPIASIRLILDTFGKRTLPPDKTQQLVRSGVQESERLHQLVNNLLFSARLETAYEPVFEPIDMEDMLSATVRKLKEKYPEAVFTTSIQPGLPHLEADHSGLTSILLNLAENAVKYSPTPAVVDIRLLQQGSQMELAIADQGFGIAESEKTRIFTQFYRVGNEDTRQTKGTGLGLYIVDQLVKVHGGQISVSENSPQGSVFRVLIPWQQPSVSTTKNKTHANTIGGR